MTAEKQAAVAAIEKRADLVAQVADEIWSFAELSLQEEQSADLYCRVLEQEGFKVERGICNIPTAFSASYGSGRPIIGLLAEYDALSGLSQKGGSLTREELVSGGCGHGCGHNLLGAGARRAAPPRHLWPGMGYGTVWMRPSPGTRTTPTRCLPAPPTPASKPSTTSPAWRPMPPETRTVAAAPWTRWS